jgi:Carbohydrate esterase, sialic acid-specific acetylesterase
MTRRTTGLLVMTLGFGLMAGAGETGKTGKPGKSKAGLKPTRVFILSGQSNMVGAGRATELPKDLAGERKNVLVWAGGKWTAYKPSRRMGPEASFTAEMAKAWPKETIGFIKYAKGGTSVTQWNPDLKAKGKRQPLYAKLMGMVKAAKEKTPGGIKIVGLLWMQGERDSRSKRLAEAYTKNLKKFIDRVRKDTGVKDLAFVLGRIRTPDSYKFRDVVRKAQTEVPKNITNSAWVDADGLEMKKDKLHYNTKGQIGLGQRFAAAFLKLVGKKKAQAKAKSA